MPFDKPFDKLTILNNVKPKVLSQVEGLTALGGFTLVAGLGKVSE